MLQVLGIAVDSSFSPKKTLHLSSTLPNCSLLAVFVHIITSATFLECFLSLALFHDSNTKYNSMLVKE